ncbi:MAG TPA: chloride channel protein [Accumulibacter sp.]|nr:chloride channel protein [Accumulibacter sp.]
MSAGAMQESRYSLGGLSVMPGTPTRIDAAPLAEGVCSDLPTPTPAQSEQPRRRVGTVLLCVLAVVIGVVTGFGAVVFRDLIGFIHNLLFLGQANVAYDANEFTPASPWGPFVILVPVLGALVVTFLVERFAPEARGHGVPEVIDAIHYKDGEIRPVVAVVKSLASAVAIGSGAAVGREGPIIQIGSALGSSLGQLVRVVSAERIILVAAGAAAGIAATFNTPIGGVLFAIELLLPEVSVQSFLPVALATGTATFVGQFFFGQQPAFAVPALAPLEVNASAVISLCLFALLGVITGLAAAGFVRGLHLMEDVFDRIRHRYLRHTLGMLLVGVLFYVLHETLGHYYVEGVGYATIQAILGGQLGAFQLLAVLFVCKLVATSLSLGSGSSGGVFSPSLFMGATIGGAFATVMAALHLPVPISVGSFAMVGMGAMVGGATGAVMTAVTMIFEMTRDYSIVMPMILAVALSVGVRRLVSPESIYTLKLVRRGHPVPKALHANIFLVRRARDLMDRAFVVAPAATDFEDFLRKPEHHGRMLHVVVTRGNRIQGVLRINAGLRRGLAHTHAGITLGDVAHRNFTVVREDDTGLAVIRRLSRKRALMALVVQGRVPRPAGVLGVITKEHVADSVAESIQVYPE